MAGTNDAVVRQVRLILIVLLTFALAGGCTAPATPGGATPAASPSSGY